MARKIYSLDEYNASERRLSLAFAGSFAELVDHLNFLIGESKQSAESGSKDSPPSS